MRYASRTRERGLLRTDGQPSQEETSCHQADYSRPAMREGHVNPLPLLLVRVGA